MVTETHSAQVYDFSELLVFENYIPPYSAAKGEDIIKGVNYASTAAGIRDETGQQLRARITMNGQVNNYKNTVSQVVGILGDEDSATNYLSQCIYSVGLGSNDYLNNYFMPTYYSTTRKVVCIGVGQIGCIPNALAQNSPDGSPCVQSVNSANLLFNDQLKSLVDDFNNNLPGAKFIYINAYGIFHDLISRPSPFGFKVTNAGCCGVGRNNGQITCLTFQTPCQNRNEYLFWNVFHPGEAANIIMGRRSYSAEFSSDAYPVNIRHLAQL
ncbi:GDSL esterase/lipase [Camellia lanceoleosa]|uniref:GDSL esterase/lipase n=1 Tax=Camellia lanceoleosa TaxID=1840588 RepID=A0ACC0GLA5_9ERIC|nr:GDSL esterase/lipase [Camellia lanceoleosa]